MIKSFRAKGNLEDEIIDYVKVTEFGLSSSDDLYKQPIDKVAKSINDIVDVEGPIHVKEVTNRIKDSCNIKIQISPQKMLQNRPHVILDSGPLLKRPHPESTVFLI